MNNAYELAVAHCRVPDAYSADGFRLNYPRRAQFVRAYSWAIPNAAAIQALVVLSPLIEIGAGTGYWAKLVADAGGVIVAFDVVPPGSKLPLGYRQRCLHYPVFIGDHEKLRAHPDRALFLCWPPYNDPMAANCLREFSGVRFAYVGEWDGGCCGGEDFWDLVGEGWDVEYEIALEQWDGMHDAFYILLRRSAPRVRIDHGTSWHEWAEALQERNPT